MNKFFYFLIILMIGCGLNNPFTPPKVPIPGKPTLLYPENGALLWKGDVIFSWLPVAKKDTYRLQISTREDFKELVFDTLTESNWHKRKFTEINKYYWRVKVRTKTYGKWSDWSDVWTFKIGNRKPVTPHNPRPADSAKDMCSGIKLRWWSGDPDREPVNYYIYLYRATPTNLWYIDTIVDTTGAELKQVVYTPKDRFMYNNDYYWQVIAEDAYKDTAIGPLWLFTTLEKPPPRPPVAKIFGEDTVWITGELFPLTVQADTDTTYDVYYEIFVDNRNWPAGIGDTIIQTDTVPLNHPIPVHCIFTHKGFHVIKALTYGLCEEPAPDSSEPWFVKVKLKSKIGSAVVGSKDERSIIKLNVDDGTKLWTHEHPSLTPITLSIDQPSGYIWIASTYNQRIFLLDSCGVNEWSPDEDWVLSSIYGECNPSTPRIDNDGNCWLVLSWINKIIKVNKDKQIIKEFALPILHPEHAVAIALDNRQGWLWVACNAFQGTAHIFKYDTAGNLLKELTNYLASYLEVDTLTGNCWVVNRGMNEVVHIRYDGTEIRRETGFNNPSGVAIDAQRKYCWITDTDNNRIVRIDYRNPTSPIIENFLSGVVYRPIGIAVDFRDGSVWICDAGNSRVIKIDVNGSILFISPPILVPTGIAIDYRERICD